MAVDLLDSLSSSESPSTETAAAPLPPTPGAITEGEPPERMRIDNDAELRSVENRAYVSERSVRQRHLADDSAGQQDTDSPGLAKHKRRDSHDRKPLSIEVTESVNNKRSERPESSISFGSLAMLRKPNIKRTWNDSWLHVILWLKARVHTSKPSPRSIIFPGHLQRLANDSEIDAKVHLTALQRTYVSWRFKTEPENIEVNRIRNQKYSIISFLPLTLINQFRYFFNIFYLVVGVSQLCPQFQIGPLFTYLAPLGFVVSMSLAKEAIDDFKRFRRDMEINNQMYEVVAPFSRPQYQEHVPRGPCTSARDLSVTPFSPHMSSDDDVYVTSRVPAANIRTGHVLRLHAGQRVPCDVLLLKTLSPESDGTTFVRTDQLDGETDWKLRRAVATTQQCTDEFLADLAAIVDVEPPRKEIYEFNGTMTFTKPRSLSVSGRDIDVGRNVTTFRESLNLENTLWTNSVVTSGPILVLALFTGKETRAAMHATKSRTKMGRFDLEVNRVSKFLCAVLLIFSFFLASAKPLSSITTIYFIRFVLLLSSIIPISLRVNLDMAKIVYSLMISQDREISGTVVRNSQLPEELGRIDVLFSDKTGTITKNKMTLQKIGISARIYVINNVSSLYQELRNPKYSQRELFCAAGRRQTHAKVRNMISAMALCHSVMPIRDEVSLSYQASSPDEMALVQFCANFLGIKLVNRTDQYMQIEIENFGAADDGTGCPSCLATFRILEVFQFSSSRKRMGIVLQQDNSEKIFFLAKGAEVVILPMLMTRPQWLEEEIDSFARSGLRSLVFAGSELSLEQWHKFKTDYTEAKTSLIEREARCNSVIEKLLERELELLGITGVEDELQRDVAETVETLGQAGVKIWMLTGDKTETALCIATSAGLKSRNDQVISVTSETHRTAHQIGFALTNLLSGIGIDQDHRWTSGELPLVLCVDGQCLDKILPDIYLSRLLVDVSSKCRGVLCCRCSPTQKSQIVKLVKTCNPSLRLAAVGDGGNDVPMIQTADCGIGIVGLEGKQASLASDFSITEFKHLKRLLLWHGRLAHQRSANLSGFVIHRGLVISAIQVIFSSIFYFTPLALFQGWLQVGYATYYTMMPVFSLVLDVDLPENVAFLFPELYKSQKVEGGLSDKSFFKTLFKSIYQGAVIMLGVIALFERQMTNIVSIAFTSLILSELLNVTSEIMTWHPLMVAAELLTVVIYAVSLLLLGDYFDFDFITTSEFWSKVAVITLVSWLPVHSFKAIRKTLNPPRYAKLISA
eukprot:Blabericola_migrator_1__12303@NODE_76_length_15181_cov_143_848948_g68_i0_p1_GENE_NODE_76_length_15181_cov_143_848948_g68_i0NODE_76_length_15181_cov_143_848948_g68_i0_p1_ORF_typecomplete_len1255_score242_95PhoLip_ATPase_C/PF16212_5/1_4e03PhoLip_ATPase_C/PF16212_5/5_4e54Hydrolase/PF00702_26/4_8e37E1E2_ATPase/PF00122_20/1_4e23E1E2_ATPase/PF00122_20/8e03E1E2_ATPase/PF00122_20/1_3e04Cation_ATPase/PF13246_6/1_9e15Cation_ATPase/PF13246_6/1_7e02PhoLip_ATPase_N/PF16209_5/5_5e15PhoLip_ATPase_N/PF16209_5/6